MSRPTRDSTISTRIDVHGAITLRGLPFQVIALHLVSNGVVPCPRYRRNATGLGSSPFARHYWGNHILFSSPAGNEMFQFPAFACMIMHDRHLDGRVAPFGNPRVKGYLHLAVDYRGLSRPSSPPRA